MISNTQNLFCRDVLVDREDGYNIIHINTNELS